MLIDGIGEKSAYLIYHAVSKIKESVYQQAIPRINPDNLSKENIKLLESIYKKWELLKVVEALKVNFKELNEAVSPDIETIKNQKGLIGSLFQSKSEKEKIKSAFDNLNQEKYKKILDNIKEMLNYILHFTVNRDELTQHFIQENASYYTEIEKVTRFKQFKISGNLPAEIVETVNNLPLDTAHLDVALRHYQTLGAKDRKSTRLNSSHVSISYAVFCLK